MATAHNVGWRGSTGTLWHQHKTPHEGETSRPVSATPPDVVDGSEGEKTEWAKKKVQFTH